MKGLITDRRLLVGQNILDRKTTITFVMSYSSLELAAIETFIEDGSEKDPKFQIQVSDLFYGVTVNKTLKRLLKGISLKFESGQMWALMVTLF